MFTAAKKIKPTKMCLSCSPDTAKKSIDDFYLSNNPMHTDGLIPYCKDCVKKQVTTSTGEIDLESLEKLLRQIDRPYYKDVLESSFAQFEKEHPTIPTEAVKYYGSDIIGLYFKNINMRQNKVKTYEDSVEVGFYRSTQKPKISKYISKDPNAKETFSQHNDFEPTDEIIGLFGEGYSRAQYKKMYEKYEKLKINYSLQTNLHQEALATYVRFKVKEEEATADGNVDEAKKWYDAAQNAAEKAKLTPRQLTQADLQGGINSFSEIFKAVEQAVDIIPILPQFKYRPNDACDFIIWCYINYCRDLQGLPSCSYEDVYQFYDKKKEEYISQYGDPYNIFEADPSEELRDNIKKFTTLPCDYEEGEG